MFANLYCRNCHQNNRRSVIRHDVLPNQLRGNRVECPVCHGLAVVIDIHISVRPGTDEWEQERIEAQIFSLIPNAFLGGGIFEEGGIPVTHLPNPIICNLSLVDGHLHVDFPEPIPSPALRLPTGPVLHAGPVRPPSPEAGSPLRAAAAAHVPVGAVQLSDSLQSCNICGEEDRLPKVRTICGHIFHNSCLNRWQTPTLQEEFAESFAEFFLATNRRLPEVADILNGLRTGHIPWTAVLAFNTCPVCRRVLFEI